MNMTLRPGEALVWRWGHTEPVKYLGSPQPTSSPSGFATGSGNTARLHASRRGGKGADRRRGDRVGRRRARGRGREDRRRRLDHAQSPMCSSAARLEVEGTGAKFEISWDGKTWESVGADLDALFPPDGPARYAYHLRCELVRRGAAAAAGDRQRPADGPALAAGDGASARTRSPTPTSRPAGAGCGSRTSGSSAPPPAPRRRRRRRRSSRRTAARPRAPTSSSGGSRPPIPTATRSPTTFELSARADMKWPLSMSFAKLISRTSRRRPGPVHAARPRRAESRPRVLLARPREG